MGCLVAWARSGLSIWVSSPHRRHFSLSAAQTCASGCWCETVELWVSSLECFFSRGVLLSRGSALESFCRARPGFDYCSRCCTCGLQCLQSGNRVPVLGWLNSVSNVMIEPPAWLCGGCGLPLHRTRYPFLLTAHVRLYLGQDLCHSQRLDRNIDALQF